MTRKKRAQNVKKTCAKCNGLTVSTKRGRATIISRSSTNQTHKAVTNYRVEGDSIRWENGRIYAAVGAPCTERERENANAIYACVTSRFRGREWFYCTWQAQTGLSLGRARTVANVVVV